jgi:AcrR family transcriptional regulator
MNPDSPSKPAPQKLRDRLRTATHDAILESAERQFAEEGPSARMETIAQAAGVSVGTLYNHFEDRSALLDALMSTRRADLLARLDEALRASDGQPFEVQLRAFISAAREHSGQHEAFMKMLFETEYAPFCAGSLQPSETMAQMRFRVEALIARGLASGALRQDDAAYFPWLFLGALRAMWIRRARGHAVEAPEAQVEATLRFMLYGAGVPR